MTFKMIRKEDGKEAICEEAQVADLEAIGFARVDAEEIEEIAEEAESCLASFVDDRSLPDLKAMGIETVQGFLSASQASIVKGVRFITSKAYNQILLKIKDAESK